MLSHHYECSGRNSAYGFPLVHIPDRGTTGTKSICRCIEDHLPDFFDFSGQALLPGFCKPAVNGGIRDYAHAAFANQFDTFIPDLAGAYMG